MSIMLVAAITAQQLLAGIPNQRGRGDTGKFSDCQLRHKSVTMPSSGELLCLSLWVDETTDQPVAVS
jgi:hypothetical protein